MAKEICISSTPHETRLAILEDDQLAEIYYERENEYTLAGSIYNGRVTRVLPGMQSAFVDVGLERDAFLYVTDFLELEDQEETDEVEKAAATGGNTPPREVRHTNGQDRKDVRPPQKPEVKPEQRQERPAQERPARDRQFTVEAVPENGEVSAPAATYASEQAAIDQEESTEAGAKRWRGRRRRRGGRGAANSPEGQGTARESSEGYVESTPEPELAAEIQAEAGAPGDRPAQGWQAGASAPQQAWAPAPAPARRFEAAPVPFVLPGESLSKYGGTAAESAPAGDLESPVAARPASSFKPTTLIETPIVWDGSGLLPGESLSKHRHREADAAGETADEEQTLTPVELQSNASDDTIEEEEFVEEMTESTLEPAVVEAAVGEVAPIHAEPVEEFQLEELQPEELRSEEEPAEEELYEETSELAPEAPAAAVEVIVAAEVLPGAEEPETDASATHHVDPTAPTGFRLFGFGSKKKEEEEAKAKTAPVSTYAPGSGLIEEEVIDEEEFEAPRHHRGKAEEHDLDDFEEETLPNQMRSGDLGEMLQEAHLDHRIQLNFDGNAGEEEDEDEEEPATEGQPTGGEMQPRRDRGGRGRRGRGTGAPVPPNRGRGPSRRSMQTSDLPIISDLLKPGQEILVQIAKEPIAKKGARITSHIALPGRFLVFMPTVSHVGVSRKIASDDERQRLKRILVHERGEASGGFIVRTAAEGASEEELRSDLRFLLNLWAEIKQRSDSSKSPALIYHDLSLIERILRDQVSTNFSNIWVDSEADYERIVRFLNRFSPTLVRRVKLYTKETPLFEHFGIQDEISKALRSKVWLKSGGSIVINQTEALVAIDINTGKYVGKSARLEDTIVKTNLDAVPEIVRQIRLRDLGGIIVIDFIDMDERKNRFKVLAALEEALKADRAPTKVLQFNDFGLVAITRKRVKQSLERTLSVPCPTCQATGMVKSPTTVCNEIYTELRKMKKHLESADVLIRVNPETVKVLKSNNASWLTEFEELVGKNILIKSDPTLHPEQFDIQG
jgi:ribonuclease G